MAQSWQRYWRCGFVCAIRVDVPCLFAVDDCWQNHFIGIKMKIGLIDVDGHGFPNLALMKIARYYRQQGADVEWYTPFAYYDYVYLSKVFTFTPDFLQCISNADHVERGGTGYKLYDKKLPTQIDKLQPDYSIYPNIVDDRTAFGFLTRGCIRNCKWCIVPKKEGMLQPYMDIEEIAIEGRNRIILMDNNILASDYGLGQIEKIIKLCLKVDFNQDMDCRLVTPEIAQMLVKVKWLKYIRFACDTSAQLLHLFRACDLLHQYGYKGDIFINVLLQNDINECINRINAIRNYTTLRMQPFAQPYLDFDGKRQPPQWQKDMARWCNRKELYRTIEFKEYRPRKGEICSQYFKF